MNMRLALWLIILLQLSHYYINYNTMEMEGMPNMENSPEKLIADATTFEELYAVIDQIGDIQGSSQAYTPEELKKIISDVQSYPILIKNVTNTHGLRKKVMELMDQKDKKESSE